MAALDWIFLAVLLASLALGLWRGLVYEVLSVLSWIVAFVVAQWAAQPAGDWLPMGGAGASVRWAAGFAVVFIAAVFTGGLVAWGVKKMVEAVGLRPVDRALGAAFGLVRGAVLLLAAALVVNATPLRTADWWTESVGASVATTALKGLRPVVPGQFGSWLPA